MMKSLAGNISESGSAGGTSEGQLGLVKRAIRNSSHLHLGKCRCFILPSENIVIYPLTTQQHCRFRLDVGAINGRRQRKKEDSKDLLLFWSVSDTEERVTIWGYCVLLIRRESQI